MLGHASVVEANHYPWLWIKCSRWWQTSCHFSNKTAAGDDDDEVRFRKTLVFPISLNDGKETAERGERGEREGCCSTVDDEDDENDNNGDDDMFSRHEQPR